MRKLWYLSALWPVLFVPFLHDPTPNGARARTVAEADTTYADGRGVYKVPAITANGALVPDTGLVPQTSIMATIPNGAGDSFLVVTYDTLPGLDALDSATASSLWIAWGYGVPYPYALAVPEYDPTSPPSIVVPPWLNEPSGMTVIVDAPFSADPDSCFQSFDALGNYEVVSTSTYNPGESSLDSVSTPPYADDDSIGAGRFTPSLGTGNAPFNLIMDATCAVNSQKYDEAYWAYYFQASENHFADNVNKVGFVELGDTTASNGSSAIYFALTGSSAVDSFRYEVFNQGTADGGERYACDLGRAIKAGQWHKIEHYAKLNTVTAQDSANPDGIHRIWLDGVLCLDTADVKFRGIEAANVKQSQVFSRIKWNPTNGSIAVPDTSYQFISHMYFSGKQSSATEAYIEIDWSDFADESEMLALRCSDNTQCIFPTTAWGGSNEWLGDWSTDDDSAKRIMLDATVVPPTPGATKSLRFDWNYTYGVCESTPITPGGICSNLGLHLNNINVDTSVASPDPKNTTELWVEFWYRYGPDYSPCNVKDAPCAYKSVFLTFPGSNSRSAWRLGGRGEAWPSAKSNGWKVGNSGAGAGISSGPVNGDSNVWYEAATSHMDAQWNGPDAGPVQVRYRDTVAGVTDTMWHTAWLYHKQGSGRYPSTATLDGRIAFWLDSVLLYDSGFDVDTGLIDPWNNAKIDQGAFTSDTLGFTGIDFGHNKDKGGDDDTLSNGTWAVPRIETMYWGPVKIYRQNPGWLLWPNDTPQRTLTNITNYDPPGYPGQ